MYDEKILTTKTEFYNFEYWEHKKSKGAKAFIRVRDDWDYLFDSDPWEFQFWTIEKL